MEHKYYWVEIKVSFHDELQIISAKVLARNKDCAIKISEAALRADKYIPIHILLVEEWAE